MRKNDKQLKILKQIAKQLLLHRVWNGKNQESIANILGVSFQQYQKVEKCENRIFAHQLMEICQHEKWDIDVIANADPMITLEEWFKVSKPVQASGIDSSYSNIVNKFNKIDDNAYYNFYRKKRVKTILPMKGD